jgi:hypothetical protein
LRHGDGERGADDGTDGDGDGDGDKGADDGTDGDGNGDGNGNDHGDGAPEIKSKAPRRNRPTAFQTALAAA